MPFGKSQDGDSFGNFLAINLALIPNKLISKKETEEVDYIF